VGAVVWGVAVVATVAAALVLRGDVVVATLESPAALLRVGAIVVAMVALSLALRRFVGNALVRGVLMAVPLGVLAWMLVVPYFTDETVVESLPGTPGTVAATTVAVAVPADGTPAPTAAPPPAGPTRLTTGTLEGIDHRASGSAALYRLVDGSHIVRLEDIDIQNGPDYFVHLVPGADRRSPGGGVDLGPLKGNKGSQNYTIPSEVDVAAGPFTVLVWCRAFSVPVANATQAPA
jgi:hypothetical protein